MSWYAKPSGAYDINSVEAKSNIKEIGKFLFNLGFTRQAISGVVGNMYWESGLNPWRWQSDYANLNNGYGLMQFTPASQYINSQTLPNYAPNLSVSQITPGAKPTDGKAQLYAFAHDRFSKWVSYCWRPYWSTSTYPQYWNKRTEVLNKWGNGSSITLEQFKRITNIEDATFVFFCCYEGPDSMDSLPNRYNTAKTSYNIIGKKSMPIYMMIKRKER